MQKSYEFKNNKTLRKENIKHALSLYKSQINSNFKRKENKNCNHIMLLKDYLNIPIIGQTLNEPTIDLPVINCSNNCTNSCSNNCTNINTTDYVINTTNYVINCTNYVINALNYIINTTNYVINSTHCITNSCINCLNCTNTSNPTNPTNTDSSDSGSDKDNDGDTDSSDSDDEVKTNPGNGIGIGHNSGHNGQGNNAIAIGSNAGNNNQGNNSISIGNNAGINNQHENSIILNATGEPLNSKRKDSLYIAPIQKGQTNLILCYNTDTNEITYADIEDFKVNPFAGMIQTEQKDIYSKVYKACSTGYGKILNLSYNCSGSFISLSKDDLKDGIFLTASHCVLMADRSKSTINRAHTFYLTNPITGKWQSINVNNIYYDGIADIAIIRTGIDFTNHPEYVLKLSDKDPIPGDVCYVCGDPGGLDTDSLSSGIVRDVNFCDRNGFQIVNTLFITAPGIGGNSGSPILNAEGDIIGIFTFGTNMHETLGGGANLYTLRKSLSELMKFQNNKAKKYLGVDYLVPTPLVLADFIYLTTEFENKGVLIHHVMPDSPFYQILNPGDVLLYAKTENKIYDFGSDHGQHPLGVLCYEYSATTISITFFKNLTKQFVTMDNIPFTKNYSTVEDCRDVPLQKNCILPGKEFDKFGNKDKMLKVNIEMK